LSYDILSKAESGWQIETNIYLNNNKWKNTTSVLVPQY
jgi:hypothetical protein